MREQLLKDRSRRAFMARLALLAGATLAGYGRLRRRAVASRGRR